MPSINGVDFDGWEGSLIGESSKRPQTSIIKTEIVLGSYAAAYAQLNTFKQWPSASNLVTVELADGTAVSNVTVVKVRGLKIQEGKQGDTQATLKVDFTLRPPAGWPA